MAPRSHHGAGKTARASGRSGNGNGSDERLEKRLLVPQVYKGVDKALIVILVFVFCGLFLWLLHSDRTLFAYWAFLALLTLIFVGILRAVGMVRSQGTVLGGSVAIFVGLFLTTYTQFEKYQDARIDDINKVMRYAETRVDGWVEFDQLPAGGVDENVFRLSLRPPRDSVDGPFQGNRYFVAVDVPVKRNLNNETQKIFKRLAVEYPGYFTGCVLLTPDETDANCTNMGDDGKFHLRLTPSPGGPSS